MVTLAIRDLAGAELWIECFERFGEYVQLIRLSESLKVVTLFIRGDENVAAVQELLMSYDDII